MKITESDYFIFDYFQCQSQRWKENDRKTKRQHGLEYTSKTGKTVEARAPKDYKACSCRYKCSDEFSPEEQVKINAEYWGLGDYAKQQLFIRTCIEIQKCKRTLTKASRRRDQTFVYKLRDRQVCKQFFKSTLNISDGFITTWAKKQAKQCVTDNRGLHGKQRKVDEATTALIKGHIESFPAIESHYTRAKSQRKYLSANLNIQKMFELFIEKYPQEKATISNYRRVFNTN